MSDIITEDTLAKEYTRQRGLVQKALDSFKHDEDLKETFGCFRFLGDFLYVKKRNEFWFRYEVQWAEVSILASAKSKGWAHVFTDLAEFDSMTGSPDPIDSHGFRTVELVEEAYKGSFE